MKTESTDKEGGQTKWPNAYKTPARLALGLSRAPFLGGRGNIEKRA